MQTNMRTSVLRSSFFIRPDGGYECFDEDIPPRLHEKHDSCNCTRVVTTRPIGSPHEVRQRILLDTKIGDRYVELLAEHDVLHFTFFWNEPDSGLETTSYFAAERAGLPPQTHHAYFWLTPATQHLQVEITRKGCGLVDCFFGSLYCGREIDTSRMMNGHSPSRIVDLEAIPLRAVWCHACCWGNEAMAVFNESESETVFWRQLFHAGADVLAVSQAALTNTACPIEELFILANTTPLAKLAERYITRLSEILDRLEATELYRRCAEVYNETRKQNPAPVRTRMKGA